MSFRTALSAPLRPLGRAGAGLIDRVVCVLGAVSFSQAPEFFQQYLQRLGGHLDEARRVLAGFEDVARRSGMSFQQYIDLLRSQSERAVADTGATMAALQERVDSLAAAELALREASAWERPLAFFRHVDWDIARGAWAVFKPAVPVTLEGALYAGAGLVAALIVYHGAVAAPCRTWAARRSARVAAPAAGPGAKEGGA